MKPGLSTLLMFASLACLAGTASAQLIPRVPILNPGPPAPPPMMNPAQLQADLRAKAGNDMIFFSARGHGLTAPSLATLRAQAAWLRANPFANVRLEGHGDQTDTREYALAVGERRAAEVRDFLATQGIAPERMSIASWGKERPGTIRVGTALVGVGPRVVMVVR